MVRCVKGKISNNPNALSQCFKNGRRVGYGAGVQKGIEEQAKKSVRIQGVKRKKFKPYGEYTLEEMRTLIRAYNKKFSNDKVTRLVYLNKQQLLEKIREKGGRINELRTV